MTSALAAAAAGLAVAVAIGLPAPRRLTPSQRRGVPHVPDLWLGVAAGLVLLLPAGPVGAVVGAVLVVLGRRAFAARRAARARTAERVAAGEAMAVLAAELRAGRPPGVALLNSARVATGPTALALTEAGSAAGLGVQAAEVLLAHAQATASPDLLRGLAICWQVCQGAGSSLAGAVDRLEEGLRAEQSSRDEVGAELAGPRATAGLLAVLPAFGLLMGAGLGASPLHVLLRTPVGNACLVVGVGLELAGVWWTGRIVRAAAGAA